MRDTPADRPTPDAAAGMRIVSWNLLHGGGASASDVEALVHGRQPDLLLMQEATEAIDTLAARIGGHYARVPLPGRRHGLACWSPRPFPSPPASLPLPSGSFVHRVCQIVRVLDANGAGWSVANVHLSHGQFLNRRQLLVIAGHLPPRACVLGDFNLVGPVLLPGFRDVGPRDPTHRMADAVPLRLDRCLVRGLHCLEAVRLPRSRSDHHPIMVRLGTAATNADGATFRTRAEKWAINAMRERRVRDTGAAAASPRRAGAPEAAAPRASRS